MTSKLENQRAIIDQQTKCKRNTPLMIHPNLNSSRPTSGHHKNQPELKSSLKDSSVLKSHYNQAFVISATSDLEIGAGEPVDTNSNFLTKSGHLGSIDAIDPEHIDNGSYSIQTIPVELNPSLNEEGFTLTAANPPHHKEHHESVDLESVFLPEVQARKMSQPSVFLPELQADKVSQPSTFENYAFQDCTEDTIQTYVESLPPNENLEDSQQKVTSKKKKTKRKKEKKQKEIVIDKPETENEKSNQEVPIAAAQDFTVIPTDIEDFILRPAPKDVTIKCRVTRDKSGIDGNLYPTYFLHFEQDSERKIFLLGSRKRKKSRTSNYIICTDPCDLSRSGKSYCGKLRSNLLGTQFTLVGCGSNQNKSGHDGTRQELAAVVYESNILGLKGPRKMAVITPQIKNEGECIDIKPHRTQDGLVERWKRKDLYELVTFHNKIPVWNGETRTHTLDFNGRATQASVKNFQIVNNNDADYIVMQLGKVYENVFSMDYNYPLCALQAFSIALSSFDVKLACE